MIDYWFEFFINKSTGVSVILLIILALRPFVLKYLNASTAYSLWLMIPLFLLLPVDFVEANGGSAMMTIFPGAGVLDSSSIIDELLYVSNIKQWVTGIWLLGLMFSVLFYGFRFKRLSQSLKHFQYQSALFENHITPNIVTSSLMNEPAVFGLLKRNLILPYHFTEYPLSKQNMILRHELYHLARRDHQINFIRIFMKCCFWFNPLVFFADKYCEADQEISCDQGVLKDDNSRQRQAYAQALIESLNQASLKQPLKTRLLSQWKYPSMIKERVKMLNNINSKKWHKWLAVVFSVSTIWMVNGVVMAEKSEITEVTPTNITQPRYPRKAAEEGLEGWVKFKFDVDKYGKPYNVELTDALPRRVFERDARRAINQWTFGKNKGQKGMVYTMEFVLE